MRPVMTAYELDAHKVDAHGRDYSQSDDGYGDIEVAAREGWHAIAAWGRDGWDLGEWPYVVISKREPADGYHELRQTCEGDTTIYRFYFAEDRDAAIDYLFLWYIAGQDVLPFTIDRTDLDAGRLTVPDEYRGPYSADRHASA